jgi:hypothetical protein
MNPQTLRAFASAVGVLFIVAAGAGAQGASARPPVFGKVPLDSLRWSGNPAGVQLATIEGDPMVAGQPYTVALRLAAGAWIQPHWHPKDQHIAVLSGALLLGHGERLDSLAADQLPVGSVAFVPGEARHFEGAHVLTTVILYGTGPMTTTFVNPPKR